MKRVHVVFSLVLLVLCSSSACADLYHVSIDLSALGGSGFRLEAALYSPVLEGSWVLMDNVTLGSTIDDFEGGVLGAFIPDPLNAGSVSVVSGSLNGTGSFVIRIDEDPAVNPTIVYRDYPGPTGSTLSFDLETKANPTTNTFDDEFVISIVDSHWNPLLVGLNGFGDVAVVNASGSTVGGLTVVPAPAALLLGLVGFGAGGLGLWRGRAHLV
jgi:hypothetical protein